MFSRSPIDQRWYIGPRKWVKNWLLLKTRPLIHATVRADSDIPFYRKLCRLYPILKKQGIDMPSPKALLGSDNYRKYHRDLLMDLDFQIEKIWDIWNPSTPLDIEMWNGHIERCEEQRKSVFENGAGE